MLTMPNGQLIAGRAPERLPEVACAELVLAYQSGGRDAFNGGGGEDGCQLERSESRRSI